MPKFSIRELYAFLQNTNNQDDYQLYSDLASLMATAVERATSEDGDSGLDGMTAETWVKRYIEGGKFNAGPWDSKADMPPERIRELEDLLGSVELLTATFKIPSDKERVVAAIRRLHPEEGVEIRGEGSKA